MNANSIIIKTVYKPLMSDLFTPIGIYLRFRDQFRDTILLESTGNTNPTNNFSFIAINAIAGIEIKKNDEVQIKYPNQNPENRNIQGLQLTDVLDEFRLSFKMDNSDDICRYAQGFFGYTSFDAIPYLDKHQFKPTSPETDIPVLRYRLYQYVIAINHHTDDMYLIENKIEGLDSDINRIETLLMHKNTPVYPFSKVGEETSNLTDEKYLEMVNLAIQHCKRGDIFQLVLSRRFQQEFQGDEFQVYRALRNINPSPYLFYFDYGDYKIFGSSPENQLIVHGNQAIIHPIAGTFKRTGDLEKDYALAKELKQDPKENAEHNMLLDLARNDLSIKCKKTKITRMKEIQYFSHVIHMVSEVSAEVPPKPNPFELIASTFPQGTLSGAPKFKAIELINQIEPSSRSFYGGCIGFVGINGSCNQAILIRSFLSRDNTLYLQAGAGIVVHSKPESELQEVNNKLQALKNAINKA